MCNTCCNKTCICKGHPREKLWNNGHCTRCSLPAYNCQCENFEYPQTEINKKYPNHQQQLGYNQQQHGYIQ